MCSVIDQQKELVYTNKVVLSTEDVLKRIDGLFSYAADIYISNRTKERKLELIMSALETAINFTLAAGDSATIIYYAIRQVQFFIQMKYLIKPFPYDAGTDSSDALTILGDSCRAASVYPLLSNLHIKA